MFLIDGEVGTMFLRTREDVAMLLQKKKGSNNDFTEQGRVQQCFYRTRKILIMFLQNKESCNNVSTKHGRL